MDSPTTPAPDHSRHRRLRPGFAAPTFHVEHVPKHAQVLDNNHSSADWRAALAGLEKHHGDRLAQLEERLSVAERHAADLGGQLNELR